MVKFSHSFVSLTSIFIHFAHPLFVQLLFDYLVAIIDHIVFGRFLRILVMFVIFRVEESAADEGWVDIIFVFATIFKGAVKNRTDIAGIEDFVVGVEAPEATTTVWSFLEYSLAFGCSHICY